VEDLVKFSHLIVAGNRWYQFFCRRRARQPLSIFSQRADAVQNIGAEK
jgi:uncharacterized ferritin-like protein (DUF455 family)